MIRHLDSILKKHIQTFREAIILLGARQVGKTTILKRLFPKAQYITADNESVRLILARHDISSYRQLIHTNSEIVILDEIHQLPDPGRTAKIIFDQIPHLKIILTGSSALNIKNKATESLAGRKIDYHLFPLTLSEYLIQKEIIPKLSFPVLPFLDHQIPLKKIYPFDISAVIDHSLIYGLYPAIMSHQDKEAYLKNLADSVIFKDLLDLSLIENRPAAANLLKLLALQIGSLVNFSELANRLSIDVKTVKKYIYLFETSFIIFPLYPFSQNPRLEISKMPKIYFYDTGLRNSLIDLFQPVGSRADTGSLFENFVISEILKANLYGNFGYKMNFWRTKQGSEIDLVLSKNDKLWGIEIKYSPKRENIAFKNRYQKAKVLTITKTNFL